MRARLVAALLLFGLGEAAAAPLTVAIFAPNSPFASADARYSFVSRMAQQLQGAIGGTVEPKAFAKASDFEAAVSKKQVDFAILDPVYLAARGVPFPVLAIAANVGETSSRWSLFASEAANVGELEGKRLAFAAASSRDAQFIDHALLDGELPRHFASRASAPDILSALSAVSLKKAEAVFAPDLAAPKGLRRLFDGGRLPHPAFVQVRGDLAASVVDQVKRAVLASTAAAGPILFDGWKPGTAEPYRSLGARMSPRPRRPVMAEPVAVSVEPGELLAPLAAEPAMVELKDHFWPPSGSP